MPESAGGELMPTMVRESIVAGQFYPAGPADCRRTLHGCLDAARRPTTLPGRVLGGVVPHAGWMCSGHVAGGVFAAIAASWQPRTLVLFSAAHRWVSRRAAVFAAGEWKTPVGALAVDEELAQRVVAASEEIVTDASAHEFEHSLEVQMPFVKELFPDAGILPIMVAPVEGASRIGASVGKAIVASGCSAAVVGTTDLTHYGPSYGFEPHGTGPDGLAWAREVNDQRMIDLMLGMQAERIVAEAATHQNACGGGAVAATISALRACGCDQAALIEHTTSHEVLGGRGGRDSVGYAGVVFGRSLARSNASRVKDAT